MPHTDSLIEESQSLIARHAPSLRVATAVPGLELYQVPMKLPRGSTVYSPRLCAVFQGGKRVEVGGNVFELRAGSGLLVALDMPVASAVTHASTAAPHLAMTFALDTLELAEVLLATDSPSRDHDDFALSTCRLDDALLDCLVRLLRLLDAPQDIAVMQPLLRREIHYRLGQGPHGAQLRRLAMADSHPQRIARATRWLGEHYAQPMRVEDLAEVAGMGVTAFHRHFKHVTHLTPLQYRSQLRLQEARRRLLAQNDHVGAVAFAVGYESQSQFGREYRRMFGRSPAADVQSLRRERSAATSLIARRSGRASPG